MRTGAYNNHALCITVCMGTSFRFSGIRIRIRKTTEMCIRDSCWRIRETILDILEKTTGGRVIFSICKVGGLRKDIDNETLREISETLEGIKAELKDITTVFIEDDSVKNLSLIHI